MIMGLSSLTKRRTERLEMIDEFHIQLPAFVYLVKGRSKTKVLSRDILGRRRLELRTWIEIKMQHLSLKYTCSRSTGISFL